MKNKPENKSKPVLGIIAGPNGSGKTTMTKLFLNHKWGQDCNYLNADTIANEQFGNWNDPEAIKKAAELTKKIRNELLDERTLFLRPCCQVQRNWNSSGRQKQPDIS